jgi:flagellar hook-associated protein 2
LLAIATIKQTQPDENMSSTVTPIGLTPTTSSSPSLAVTGLASGMDWSTVVAELGDAERAPETQWKSEQTTLNNQNSAFTTIAGDLATLKTDVETLQSSSLYTSRTAQTSNSAVATASAASGATLGTFTFDISQLATASQVNGQSSISTILSPGGDLNNVTIGTAGFATPVTAGTFTVNGAQVTVATTDSLQQVFDNISKATNGEVTASYDSSSDSSSDAITLADNKGNNIVLGSATDTSNFLQSAGLYNNGSTSVTSLAPLGHVQLTAAMGDADLKTAITDGGGQGAFTINGVTINYDASTDSVQDVLDRINSSSAGVTASYDTQNNRFVMTNNSTGDMGISMQDVTGNFLAATGLSTESGGTLARGQNLLYTLNGGKQQLVSQSNTITSASSGITGLSVTALATTSAGSSTTSPDNPVTVTVASDTSGISSAIQQFVTDYNAVQSYVTSQMAVTNNADGSVTSGLLTGDMTANGIASSLRSTGFSDDASLALSGSAIQSLADLGITTNGQNNTVALDTDTLNSALTSNLSAVQSFFTDANGPVTQLNNYLDDTIGSTNSTTPGTLTQHETDLSTQSSDITKQISNLETKITSDTQMWNSEFDAMEQAESQTNSELTYLSEQVSNGSL